MIRLFYLGAFAVGLCVLFAAYIYQSARAAWPNLDDISLHFYPTFEAFFYNKLVESRWVFVSFLALFAIPQLIAKPKDHEKPRIDLAVLIGLFPIAYLLLDFIPIEFINAYVFQSMWMTIVFGFTLLFSPAIFSLLVVHIRKQLSKTIPCQPAKLTPNH